MFRQAVGEDRYVCVAEFITAPPAPFRYFQWSQATYEGSIKDAGFREFAWLPSEVAPEDLARHGAAYWRGFYDNCLVIGIVCRK
jgi:toxoflavin synthase